MIKLFSKNPAKKLIKAYESKLSDAMKAQRNGDIKSYSLLSQEAEAIYQDIKALQAGKVQTR